MSTTRENLARRVSPPRLPGEPREVTLRVLAAGVPLPILLLDEGGRLVWYTEAARSRLADGRGLEALAERRRALEELGASVRDAARARPAQASFRCTVAGEPLLVRRIEAAGSPPFYVATCVNERGGETRHGAAREASTRAKRLARRFGLTRRERHLLVEVARGRSNREIGALLGAAVATVMGEVRALTSKLGCANRAELVARFWTA